MHYNTELCAYLKIQLLVDYFVHLEKSFQQSFSEWKFRVDTAENGSNKFEINEGSRALLRNRFYPYPIAPTGSSASRGTHRHPDGAAELGRRGRLRRGQQAAAGGERHRPEGRFLDPGKREGEGVGEGGEGSGIGWRLLVAQTLEVPLLAVSKPILAIQVLLCSILQHFSRSTRLTRFCTAPICDFWISAKCR